jgi:hypothetical protein
MKFTRVKPRISDMNIAAAYSRAARVFSTNGRSRAVTLPSATVIVPEGR